ncbi:hypothetical protein G9A89_002739 [Geosiphon pyriformis]|nr:hypothetical protein G9A89_002739 [Geosiphon pyriformis]
MKALHHRLPVAKRKRLYSPSYPSVACIRCGMVEDSDHKFSCVHDSRAREELISNTIQGWIGLLGASAAGCEVIRSLREAGSSDRLYMSLAKGFVMKEWVAETTCLLGVESDGGVLVVELVRGFAEVHRSAMWLPTAKLRAHYEKHNLLVRDGSSIPSISGLSSLWSPELVHSFGFRLGTHVCFGLHPCLSRMRFGFLRDFPVCSDLGV